MSEHDPLQTRLVELGLEVPDVSALHEGGNPADFGKYGRFLGKLYANENGVPQPPTEAQLNEAAHEFGGPTIKKLYSYIGGLTVLNDLAGIVTVAVAAQWDEDKLLENGRWFSHMLGSPESPKRISQGDLHEGSSLFISPSLSRIERAFGNLTTYNDRLGFVTDVTMKRWTDQDWIDNGTWLSHSAGSPRRPRKLSADELRQGASASISPPISRIYKRYLNHETHHPRCNNWYPRSTLV